ncbi:MAG TPA: substrate-binding domain-containing protein [Candidatus Cybelea sp.]
MRRLFFTLGFAAIPALLMSACNGNAGGAGLTPQANASHRVGHPLDNSAADIHAGGADFPAYAYNLGDQPVGLYTSAQPTPGPGSILYEAAKNNADGNNYYYCLSSSGYGKNEFDANDEQVGTGACAAIGQTRTGFGGRTDPVDFVGTDVGLASNECCASGSAYANSPYAATYGQPFQMPTFGGPIVFPYINDGTHGLTGLGSNRLKLSTWTYCAIANGTIGRWNDPAITADNGGTPVAGNQAITFVYRSDTSGTTYLFETKLNDSLKGCNQTFKGKYAKAPYTGTGRSAAWPYGIPSPSNSLWSGPTGAQTSGSTFVGANGNPAVIETIQGYAGSGYPYATGYALGAWAAAASNPPVQQAALLSGSTFVSPTDAGADVQALAKATASKLQYGVGSDGNSLGSSTPTCQFYIAPSVFVDPPAGAYPIVGLSYFLFYGKDQTRAGSNHYTDLKNLIAFIDSETVNAELPNLEYSPLPASTQKKIQQAAFGKGIKGTGACFRQ